MQYLFNPTKIPPKTSRFQYFIPFFQVSNSTLFINTLVRETNTLTNMLSV